MDRHALTAKNSIGHVLRGIPADDPEIGKHRETLEKCVEALKDLLEKCQTEAHASLSKSVPRELECPCARCKAKAYIEVITALPYDELLELIMYGETDGEPVTDCKAPESLENEVVSARNKQILRPRIAPKAKAVSAPPPHPRHRCACIWNQCHPMTQCKGRNCCNHRLGALHTVHPQKSSFVKHALESLHTNVC